MGKLRFAIMVVLAATAISAKAQGGANVLRAGQVLQTGQYLYSAVLGNAYWHKLIMQGDGNLVLYLYTKDGKVTPKWSTSTNTPGSYVAMQSDGNFVVYRPNGTPAWDSRTGGHALNLGYNIVLWNDGSLNIYPPGPAIPIWSANKQTTPTDPNNICGPNTSSLPVQNFPTCTVTGAGVKIPGFVAAHCSAEAAAQAASVGATLGACS